MEREDRVAVLQAVQGLDGVPVMEMEYIELLFAVDCTELVNHLPAHVITELDNIPAIRFAVMVLHSLDNLVGDGTPGEEMHLMVLRDQGLCKVGCSISQSADTFSVHR